MAETELTGAALGGPQGQAITTTTGGRTAASAASAASSNSDDELYDPAESAEPIGVTAANDGTGQSEKGVQPENGQHANGDGSQQAPDAVSFLLAQHAEIRRLFVRMDEGERSQETFQALVRLLAVHETAEEEVVYPAARRFVPDGDRIADARLEEEDQAKKALSDLEKFDLDDSDFAGQFAIVRDMVLAHAEAEERELFPQLRDVQNREQLERMASALQAAEAMAPTHPHKSAPESATGNMLMGPFVAIADRVRDALRGR